MEESLVTDAKYTFHDQQEDQVAPDIEADESHDEGRESPSLLKMIDLLPQSPPTAHIEYDQAGPSNLSPRDPQANTYVSLFDISPLPITKKRASNRGRKPVKSAVITSSPYKRKS